VSTFLWGGFCGSQGKYPGSGKTHLLCAIGQELIRGKGRQSLFYLLQPFVTGTFKGQKRTGVVLVIEKAVPVRHR
jgi:chromosomal replication initiation ATPase DnaA